MNLNRKLQKFFCQIPNCNSEGNAIKLSASLNIIIKLTLPRLFFDVTCAKIIVEADFFNRTLLRRRTQSSKGQVRASRIRHMYEKKSGKMQCATICTYTRKPRSENISRRENDNLLMNIILHLHTWQ